MTAADRLLVFAAPLPLPEPGHTAAAGPAIDRWRDGDIGRATALLSAAYPPAIAALFTPRGSAAEWRTYVTVLVRLGPCGIFQHEWSRVIRDDAGELLGVALVTRVAPGTAHLAQLAVRPDVQRGGLATRLVCDAAAAAHAAGCRELTLLVARGNEPARRLYESLGFTARTLLAAG